MVLSRRSQKQRTRGSAAAGCKVQVIVSGVWFTIMGDEWRVSVRCTRESARSRPCVRRSRGRWRASSDIQQTRTTAKEAKRSKQRKGQRRNGSGRRGSSCSQRVSPRQSRAEQWSSTGETDVQATRWKASERDPCSDRPRVSTLLRWRPLSAEGRLPIAPAHTCGIPRSRGKERLRMRHCHSV